MTDRMGFAIDPTTNDLFLDGDGSVAIVRNGKAVAEHVRQRLLTHEKEWFLDTTAGVVWLDEIFGNAYDPALAESVVKAEILDTDGVTEITSFSVRFDRASRGLLINEVEVLTEYDDRTVI